MNYSTAVFLINTNVRAIATTYEAEGKTTVYKTLDPTIKKDDLVIVPTNTRHKFTVVKVTEIDVDIDFDSATEILWIADKVQIGAYEKLIADEADAVAKIRKAETRKKRESLAENLRRESGIGDELGALAITSAGAPQIEG